MGKDKKRKHKKKSKRQRYSSDESSSETEWVEKSVPAKEKEILESTTPPRSKQTDLEQREWLNIDTVFATTSTADRKISREIDKQKKKLEDLYNPSSSSRELNPYWRDGGTGLPTFKKPSNDLDYDTNQKKEQKQFNWKASKPDIVESQINKKNDRKEISSSLDPNAIAAKLVKAEIMGNTKLVEELKLKLEEAKQVKIIESESNSDILLTQTNSKGFSRPLTGSDDECDFKKKKRKVETHSKNERTKYYADDDRYSLKQMFEAEKYNSVDSSNKEFAKMASSIKKNDNLEDIFTDKIRHHVASKDVNKAISEQQRIIKSVDNCTKCLQSEHMLKYLIVDYEENCYLSLPSHEPLTEGHCLLSPVRHVSCSVQLDENEWNEFNVFRRKLIQLFEKQDKSLVFFEISKSVNRCPHMVLECIPIPKKKKELAKIYFRKAIEESEYEWSHNKKLISLNDRDVTKAIPKGLPYFFVSFGMNEGFAHIIEDQNMFPYNFAQEVIGGMLNIDHSKWRKPKRENLDSQNSRVSNFKKWWKNLSNN